MLRNLMKRKRLDMSVGTLLREISLAKKQSYRGRGVQSSL